MENYNSKRAKYDAVDLILNSGSNQSSTPNLLGNNTSTSSIDECNNSSLSSSCVSPSPQTQGPIPIAPLGSITNKINNTITPQALDFVSQMTSYYNSNQFQSTGSSPSFSSNNNGYLQYNTNNYRNTGYNQAQQPIVSTQFNNPIYSQQHQQHNYYSYLNQPRNSIGGNSSADLSSSSLNSPPISSLSNDENSPVLNNILNSNLNNQQNRYPIGAYSNSISKLETQLVIPSSILPSSNSSSLLTRASNCNESMSSSDGSMPIKKRRPVPVEVKDKNYWEKRKKNNESAKRSRDNRRSKEETTSIRVAYLEQENLKLHTQVSLLTSEIDRLRAMLYNANQQTINNNR